MTINELADDLLRAAFTAQPLDASLAGLPGYDDRLADHSVEAERALAATYDDIARRAEALADGDLGGADRVTLDFVRHMATAGRDSLGVRAVEWTVTDFFVGPASLLVTYLPQVALTTPERAAGMLTRLAAVPAHLQAVAVRHREGVAGGRTPVARLVRAAVDHIDRVLADDDLAGLRMPAPDASVVADPAAWAAERDRRLEQAVRPALRDYRDVLEREILPAARGDEQVGLCWLPDGKEDYRVLARGHTSTTREPDELHATGLAIVERLAEEYAELGQRVFGTSDLAVIFDRLRRDETLRYGSAEEMLDQARAAIARAEAAAPDWFGRVPAGRCQVAAIPAAEAPGAAPAYYLPPALDGSRPGTYFLNTHEPTQRFRYNAEGIAFHEAVPGHHFQIALAQELTELPLVRRLTGVTAFAEGWGLYAERLADEMGLYSADLTRLGMLTLDSWRAGRLVVDTGMHALGWSREQAVAWMRDNTPLSPLEIETEIDRYIAIPGQALAYMVGRLELQALRQRAQDRLGDAFDLRGFHDLVLGGGMLPLAVLGEVVDRWDPRSPA